MGYLIYMSMFFCVCIYLQSGKTQQVKQFHITNWAADGSCSGLETIVQVIERVEDVQRKTSNCPIVVHCR